MVGGSKSAAIVCGLMAALWTAGPRETFAQTQAAQEQTAPVYANTGEGFNAQMMAALDAYQRGDKDAGRRLVEQFRLPHPSEWFTEKFGAAQVEALTRRYDQLADSYTNYTERLLGELAANKIQKVNIELKPGTKEPPPVAANPRAATTSSTAASATPGGPAVNRTPSGLVPIVQLEGFNAYFRIQQTPLAETLVTGVFKARYWEDTFVYQDGAFRFVGHGAWPFWAWNESVQEDAAPVDLPTPLELDAETVDEVVPFPIDRVTAALKPAMESKGCQVKQETLGRIECKRKHERGYGGESVTALLEAQGDQTHVHITTGKGFYGRLGKENWSVPIYRAMLSGLKKTPNA